MGESQESKIGKDLLASIKESERQHKLKLESYQANIDAAKRSWAERNPFKMLLIGAVIGFLLNYILEYLKLHHKLGL